MIQTLLYLKLHMCGPWQQEEGVWGSILHSFLFADKTVWCQDVFAFTRCFNFNHFTPAVSAVWVVSLEFFQDSNETSALHRTSEHRAKHLTGTSLKGPSLLQAVFIHLTDNFLLQFAIESVLEAYAFVCYFLWEDFLLFLLICGIVLLELTDQVIQWILLTSICLVLLIQILQFS